MTNLSQPEITNPLAELRDLHRRVSDLERGNPLVGSIPQGESISVLDPNDGSKLADIGATSTGLGAEFRDSDGDIVARMGDLSDARKGIELYNGSGIQVFKADDRGLMAPHIPVPFASYNGFYTFAAPLNAWVKTFEADITFITSKYLMVKVFVGVNAGVTDARIRVTTLSGQIGATKTLTASTSVDYTCYITLNEAVGASAHIYVEAWSNVASGVNVYPVRASMGDFSAISTSGGVWTP
ncbi:MAG: hypothetical protein ACKV2O_15460 [Acidimicrobiales bacterium]